MILNKFFLTYLSNKNPLIMNVTLILKYSIDSKI